MFDAILRSAVRLCEGVFGNLYRFDGELVHQVADYNFTAEARETARRQFPAPLSRGLVGTRAILERRIVQIPDTEHDPEYDLTIAQAVGFRSVLGVPMFREGSVVGTINIGRAEPGPFSPKQIALLQTFADQAVIAIENVRLFTELEARTQDLTRSVDELTALGEVGRALSSTLDLETVLKTIVARANELAGTDSCLIYEYDDASEEFRLRASSYADPERERFWMRSVGRRRFPKGRGW